MDVKLAFLNGDLLEEVLILHPSDFVVRGRENKVLKLSKTLYGLHQAPRTWYPKLDVSLLLVGFQRCPSDPAIYCRGDKSRQRLIVGVYVDDLVITGSSREEIQKFKREMMKMFKMGDLGLMHYYLGIEVRQGPDGFSLCQENYAKGILEKAGLKDCNPTRHQWSKR
jgi:hypothetical protein